MPHFLFVACCEAGQQQPIGIRTVVANATAPTYNRGDRWTAKCLLLEF
ncbi:hypothetical protein RBSWK_00574 [Rhodopirellula baltica SWK14]|uniref:Uncharacterized protein n=1 Tax=Rhodopirellula baltica SWK14 TaxID=993516 RepID=L7CQU3_RHOBT|nr:hypothetical protein RBSWK_00574 [Rhodopirellula baltica SWK14]